MNKTQKQKLEEIGGNLSKPKMRLVKGTKLISFLFIAISVLIGAGFIQAANVYYDLDTGKIMMGNNLNATAGLNVTTGNLDVGSGNFIVDPASGDATSKGKLGLLETGSTPTYYTYVKSGDITGGANITYTLPGAYPGGSGYVLQSDTSGNLSWSATAAATAHNLLDAGVNQDTTASSVLRGSIIVGNSTPKWTALAVGSAGQILRVNSSGDTVWSAATYPDTTTANQLLFSSAANTVGGVTAGTSGQFLVANGSGVPTFVTASGDATIASTGAITIANGAVTLGAKTSGNYVATGASGNGVSLTGGGSAGATLTAALGNLTSDWNQTGNFNIVLDSATSRLKIRGTGGAYYGAFSPGALTSDQTYTFPNQSGTVAMTSDVTSFGTTGALRGQASIFGFDYPAQCSTSCVSGAYKIFSRTIDTWPNFPAALSGKTRKYALVIRYADTAASGTVNFQVYDFTGTAIIKTFTPTFGASNIEQGKVYFSDLMTTAELSTLISGNDWYVQAGLSAGAGSLRIYSIELAAYDVD